MRTPHILSAAPADRTRCRRLLDQLQSRSPQAPVRLSVGIASGSAPARLPEPLLDLLATLLAELAAGRSMAVQPLGQLVTMAQAARILRMKRADLDRLLSAQGIRPILDRDRQRLPLGTVLGLWRSRSAAAGAALDRTITAYDHAHALEP